MILDHIANIGRYKDVFPYVNEVVEFLSKNDLRTLELKEATPISENVSLIPIDASQSPASKNTLEAHRKKTDIHCTVTGTDTVVYRSVSECSDVETPYQDADDYMLFRDTYKGELTIPEGYFCLITPDMAHMAMCGEGQIKKFVFKVNWKG